jgi:hypothetical protein
LLAELKQLVKHAGAYEGVVVIEASERNRADKLQRELDGRAVVDQELERLRVIEREWKRLESQLAALVSESASLGLVACPYLPMGGLRVAEAVGRL